MPLKEIADRRNLLHRKSDAQTILRHAIEDVRLGDTALVSSFGAESVVLLHMAAQIDASVPVIFLDTEMLFAETLAYQHEVAQTLGLTDVRVVRPDRAGLLIRDSEGLLHQADVDACCTLRKTEPLQKALAGFGSWVTGRKQYHGGQRTDLPVFEKEVGSARIKVNPLARWGRDEIAAYMNEHDLPRHPLEAKGYPSVGCWPCTNRVSDVSNPRAGRWESSAKTECGIHL
ncbi:phosphoadenylyl-sulfate reductase [Yoonia sp. 208BN28-4]|uniref:phosphoadenylyl-sulfate reductase n=1 Tax=Yoonia sp. 208BN28-4 TaxID=3126505 RepID=UPI003095957C